MINKEEIDSFLRQTIKVSPENRYAFRSGMNYAERIMIKPFVLSELDWDEIASIAKQRHQCSSENRHSFVRGIEYFIMITLLD